MEGWAAELASGRPDAAWDLFLDRYRRLIFAAIRHYAQDHDDVMDVFARVCEALREDVHHVVMVLGVVTDRREDETSIAVEKQVPRGVGFARLQLGRPAFHPHDLQRGLAGYTSRRRPVKR